MTSYLSDVSLEWTDEVKQQFANDIELFWQKILINVPDIESLLQARELTRYNKIREIIKITLQELDFNIDVHFGIDVRNGQLLDERKDHIEMILSPANQKYNIKLINHLHKSNRVKQLPKLWSVIKYKFYQPRLIDNMILNYVDKSDLSNNSEPTNPDKNEDTIIEVSKDDFEYFPVLDIPNSKINLILFISDDKASLMLNKRVITKSEFPTLPCDRTIWYPKDTTIYTVIDCAVGEYNTMNCIDKIEIYLKSEQPELIRKPINLLINEIMMMNNNPLSSIQSCARCSYQNKQISLLVCHCKKTKYCDIICQKAHRYLHKDNCM
jgi:hypothetical protein